MATKPWDSRLAHLLVLPLRNTGVRPNHVTTAGLVVGLAAAALYATGARAAADWGAALFVVSAVLDHADGELARLTGKTSAAGHRYDRVADLIVKLVLFLGMGAGLRHGPFGGWTLLAGAAAGVSFIAIFTMRGEMERRQGPAAVVQPRAAGFELEDILYVIAPLTWMGGLGPFVIAAGVGAPLFALRVARQYRSARAPALAARAPSSP